MLVDDKPLKHVAQHLRVRDRPLDNRQPLQRSVAQELQHGAIGVNEIKLSPASGKSRLQAVPFHLLEFGVGHLIASS